jgi:hypothetical protein
MKDPLFYGLVEVLRATNRWSLPPSPTGIGSIDERKYLKYLEFIDQYHEVLDNHNPQTVKAVWRVLAIIEKFNRFASHKKGGSRRVEFFRYLANRVNAPFRCAGDEIWNAVADALEAYEALPQEIKDYAVSRKWEEG